MSLVGQFATTEMRRRFATRLWNLEKLIRENAYSFLPTALIAWTTLAS
jgi:hypothetical protein